MQKERIFGLDILRASAILTILMAHMFTLVPTGINPTLANLLSIDGVNIFFTLSGFLIGTILFKQFTRDVTYKTVLTFWRNRWWRTLPAYFTVLLIIIVYSRFHTGLGSQFFIKYFFFLQNFQTGQIYIFLESWSLSIEEWFYLIFPLILFVGSRFLSLKKVVLLAILFMLMAGTVIKVYKIHSHTFKDGYDYSNLIRMCIPARIDAVIWGVLGAYLNFYNAPIWVNYRKSFFSLGLLCFIINTICLNLMPFNVELVTVLKELELLFVLMTIPYLLTIKTGKGPVAKSVSFIALISYSIYLTHYSLFQMFIQPLLPANGVLQLVGYYTWAILSAFILYSTVEKWGMRQRSKRFLKMQGPKPAIVPYNSSL